VKRWNLPDLPVTVYEFIENTAPILIKLIENYFSPHNDAGLKHARTEVIKMIDAELEFMLHQTGGIIRLFDRLFND
jgi:hypothetical protein